METINTSKTKITHLQNPVHLIGVKASSFPEGVPQAHDELRNLLNNEHERTYYGISHPVENGSIMYLAAATQLDPETDGQSLETFTIQPGAFLSVVIDNWKENIGQIKEAFDLLITDPRGDKLGYCLEEYFSDDAVRCMVPLAINANWNKEREALVEELNETFEHLSEVIAKFPQQQIDKKPFEGSWSAGQVAEHIIICGSQIPDEQVKPANRFADEKVPQIHGIFLDFTQKFEANPNTWPKQDVHDKQELLETFAKMRETHVHTIKNMDMEKLCTVVEFPTLGFLTRLEWIKFILAHTQRHTRQIEHIYGHLQ